MVIARSSGWNGSGKPTYPIQKADSRYVRRPTEAAASIGPDTRRQAAYFAFVPFSALSIFRCASRTADLFVRDTPVLAPLASRHGPSKAGWIGRLYDLILDAPCVPHGQ